MSPSMLPKTDSCRNCHLTGNLSGFFKWSEKPQSFFSYFAISMVSTPFIQPSKVVMSPRTVSMLMRSAEKMMQFWR